ncbi:MAG: hypothetical protein JO006_07585 [Paucibacter sp.]|nr:hypothetical protein [Roseateles sp.]
MFRYLALVWDAAQPAHSAAAQRLAHAWCAQLGWEPVLTRAGVQVFILGAKAGINEASLLPGGQGVVLGKVFRRVDPGQTSPGPPALDGQDGKLILDSRGRTLVESFWGRYIAFLPTECGSTAVLRDPSGTLPCYRIVHEGVSIVFSWLEDALQLLGDSAKLAVNWDALLTHMQSGALTGRETSLDGVTQVLPGELLNLQQEISTLMWNPVDIARTAAMRDPDEATQALWQQVLACTQAWASCYDRLLVRLSGGVDSSILFSCLRPDRTDADVLGLNYYSAGSDSDERHYARLTAAKVGRDLLERERDPDFRVDRVLEAARMPDPVRYVGWMNAATDAKVASAHRASAMITGAGGDSLFYEFPRWWPAADYLHMNGVNAGFATVAMDAARLGKVSVWRAISLAVKDRWRPSLSERSFVGRGTLLSPDLVQPRDRQRFDHPGLDKTDDLPIGKYMQTLALMQPLGYYDPFERDRAPEIVNPLFSQPLVELCLRLPTFLLAQGGRGRALARRAFAADLPPQIINRRSKGGLEEHVRAVLLSNIDFVRTTLLQGQLAARQMIDRPTIEALLSGEPTALAGPNSQLHALVAVEAWLARWSH